MIHTAKKTVEEFTFVADNYWVYVMRTNGSVTNILVRLKSEGEGNDQSMNIPPYALSDLINVLNEIRTVVQDDKELLF